MQKNLKIFVGKCCLFFILDRNISNNVQTSVHYEHNGGKDLNLNLSEVGFLLFSYFQICLAVFSQQGNDPKIDL